MNVTVQCGCSRTMHVDSLRGAGAFRCGCGARAVVTVTPPPRAPVTRCIATELGTHERCLQETCAHPGFELLCEEHYQRMYQWVRRDIMNELEHVDSEEIHRRRYAEFYARTRRGWELGDDRTAELVEQQHAARGETTLDPRRWLERGSANKPTVSMIYYAQHGDQIKIGTSVAVPDRIRDLSLPASALLATEPGGLKRERELHDYWAPARAHGEWFWAVPALVAYIDALPGCVRSSSSI